MSQQAASALHAQVGMKAERGPVRQPGQELFRSFPRVEERRNLGDFFLKPGLDGLTWVLGGVLALEHRATKENSFEGTQVEREKGRLSPVIRLEEDGR